MQPPLLYQLVFTRFQQNKLLLSPVGVTKTYEMGEENSEESQGPDNSLIQETMHCDVQVGITGSSYFKMGGSPTCSSSFIIMSTCL
jgi:hypothetical protein